MNSLIFVLSIGLIVDFSSVYCFLEDLKDKVNTVAETAETVKGTLEDGAETLANGPPEEAPPPEPVPVEPPKAEPPQKEPAKEEPPQKEPAKEEPPTNSSDADSLKIAVYLDTYSRASLDVLKEKICPHSLKPDILSVEFFPGLKAKEDDDEWACPISHSDCTFNLICVCYKKLHDAEAFRKFLCCMSALKPGTKGIIIESCASELSPEQINEIDECADDDGSEQLEENANKAAELTNNAYPDDKMVFVVHDKFDPVQSNMFNIDFRGAVCTMVDPKTCDEL